MRITYDPAKNDRNIAERGLPFELVAELDWDSAVAREDTRKDYGERRVQTFALLSGRLHVAVITVRAEACTSSASARLTRRRLSGMSKRKDELAALPDDENPEWSEADFRSARPALDVIAGVFGPEAATALRRKGGRPAKPDRKINQTLRLDPDVVEAYRQEGPGWQAQMNRVLRTHMPRYSK